MRVIDLSRNIESATPPFPGDPAPEITELASFERDGCRVKRVALCTHTGTHIDAPAHMIKDGATLDRLPCGTFFGRAAVCDVRNCAERKIESADIAMTDAELAQTDFLLFYTGYEDKWGGGGYLRGFPVLADDAAHKLAQSGLKGIGVDAISADPVESEECPVHKILLSAGVLIIENLCGLGGLPRAKPFRLAALPLPLKDADGAPARVTALLDI